MLGGGFYGAIAQALSVVTGHHQLHGGKKVADKVFFLIIEVLRNAFEHRYTGAFEFNHTQSDTVHIQHQIWAFFVLSLHGHFFSDGKVVCVRFFPINQPNGLILLARTFFILHAIAQQLVNVFVGVIQMFAFTQAGRFIQLTQRTGNQRRRDITLGEPFAQNTFFNIAVISAVFPIT